MSLDDFAWATPELRQRLLDEPRAVLSEQGVNLPTTFPPEVVHEVVRIVSLLWVDGQLVPVTQFKIDPFDEGLLFGRGVWESTRTCDGVPWLWALHLGRLRQTAAMLNIPLESARLPDSNQVRDYVRSLTKMDVIVRLNVTAGRFGKPGIVWLSAWLMQAGKPSLRLQSCINPVQKGQPYLIWKTFQYATRMLIGQQAGHAGFDTALLLDAEKNVQEAAHANIFVRLPEGWVTPVADGGLLPGTVRQFLLNRSPYPVREQRLPYELLAQASEAFLTNSNVGIVPIEQIDDKTYPLGPETKELLRWLQPVFASHYPHQLVINSRGRNQSNPA